MKKFLLSFHFLDWILCVVGVGHGTYFWRIDHRCLGDHPLRCRFSNFYYFSTMKNCFVADVLKNLGSSASFLFVFS